MEQASFRAASAQSTLVEKSLEYRLLAELTGELLRRDLDYDVLRGDVDRHGHDLLIEAAGTARHIQLKAMIAGGKRAHVEVKTSLADKPSACVIWMIYDPQCLGLTKFLWFGNPPGIPLPELGDRVARHTKFTGDRLRLERVNHRVVQRGRFRRVATVAGLTDRLFGVQDPLGHLKRHTSQRDEATDLDWLQAVRSGNFRAIPEDLCWDQSAEVAMLVDGYELLDLPTVDRAAEFLDMQHKQAESTGIWPGGPIELWATLFLEHRRRRFVGPYEPSESDRQLLNRLVQQLRTRLTALEPSPAAR